MKTTTSVRKPSTEAYRASQTMTIRHKMPSWNQLVGKSFWAVKKLRDEMKQATWRAILEFKIERATEFPVTIHIHAIWKGHRTHDIDSLYAKSLLDQLVSSRILPDDSLPYVEKVIYTGETGAKEDQITIELSSLKAKHRTI